MRFFSKIKKIDFKKMKSRLKNLPYFFAAKPLLIFLILFIFALLWSLSLFYKYSFLPQKKEIKDILSISEFDETAYQKILEILREKEKRLQEIEIKEYPDFFR